MFQPFSPNAETRVFRNRLPHWRQPGVTYFITTRMADSVPHGVLRQWQVERENWLRSNDCKEPEDLDGLPDKIRREYHERFTAAWHRFLDAGSGECALRDPENACVVASALRHFDGERYLLDDFVVMPNHLHVLVTPAPGHELSDILKSWKGFAARQINQRTGRSGALWQPESFNHIVRSPEQLERFRRYIEENPVKGRLRCGEYLLWQAPGTGS